MTAQTYNIGIIGYGVSAKVFHIPILDTVSAFKLHAVVQRNPQPENDAAKDIPGIKSYRTSEELFQDGDVHVVIVTTTPETHFELSRLALGNGKHVVVEKPFTPTSKEAQDLISIAEKNKRLLTVYQNRRWDSDFVTVQDLIKNGTLGRIVEFETHFDRFRPEVAPGGGWKTRPTPGGGSIYDLGTHLIDQVIVLFGLPKRITGFVGSQREHNPSGYEDSCTVFLHYDGLLASVKAAVVSPEVRQLRYWVRGTKGSWRKHDLDVQEDQLKAGKKPGDDGYGIENDSRFGVLTTVRDGTPSSATHPTNNALNYQNFYMDLAQALDGKGAVPVDPRSSAAVIRLIELARQSSQEGKTLDVDFDNQKSMI